MTHPGDHPLDDGDEAEGRWYLQDRVIVPRAIFIRAAFYQDTYRKHLRQLDSDHLQRTYEVARSLRANGDAGTGAGHLHWVTRSRAPGCSQRMILTRERHVPSSRATHPAVAPPLVVWTKNATVSGDAFW